MNLVLQSAEAHMLADIVNTLAKLDLKQFVLEAISVSLKVERWLVINKEVL